MYTVHVQYIHSNSSSKQNEAHTLGKFCRSYFFCFFSFTRDARNMARDVHETLEKIITECGNMDKEKATNYVKQMQNKGRYSCDVWS